MCTDWISFQINNPTLIFQGHRAKSSLFLILGNNNVQVQTVKKIIKPPLYFYSFHNVYIWPLFGTMFKLFLWYFTKVIQTVIQGQEAEAMLDKVQSIKSGLAFSRPADGAQL